MSVRPVQLLGRRTHLALSIAMYFLYDCLQEVIWKSTSIRLLLASSILKLVAVNIILRRRRVDIEFSLSVGVNLKHRCQVSTPVAIVRR